MLTYHAAIGPNGTPYIAVCKDRRLTGESYSLRAFFLPMAFTESKPRAVRAKVLAEFSILGVSVSAALR